MGIELWHVLASWLVILFIAPLLPIAMGMYWDYAEWVWKRFGEY